MLSTLRNIVIILLTFANIAYAEVQVKDVNDINFGRWPGRGGLRGADTLCISVPPRSLYTVVIRSNAFKEFAMSNGIDKLSYSVFFNDSASGKGVEVKPNVPLTGQRSAAGEEGCRSNAHIQVEILEQNLRSAVAGRYTDSLSVTVLPE